MSRTIENDINDYIYRIQMIRDSILALKGGDLLVNHKKNLLFSLLDTISKGVYGDQIQGNGKRFGNFILEFCNWNNAERVSLQQLALFLRKVDKGEHNYLKKYTFNELSKYPQSKPVPFSVDPYGEEILPYLSSDKKIYKKITLDYFKHVNLLWRYRNSLVHEARSIGSDRLFDFENEPHYIHYYHLSKDEKGNNIKDEYWEKYYPLNFFITLVDNAIINMEVYFIENEVNPFENYVSDPLWITEVF
ncbi:hypothetical protein [Radiobacillus deserti]|uniref:Uncharacterized protein n=1 Tax=Radiobacillus deserti TaxID=2594883 RepID=A0A516KKQ5_9BACI|nr:hypothetical protein [Radiobacillus deserti]QDP41971.1 hypothetical protein FN924_18435 [Radiobacillus deserti]